MLSFNAWQLERQWPEVKKAAAPEFTPGPVSAAYIEAQDAQMRSSWRAAGVTFRSTLEIALKVLDPDTKGLLAARIKALAEAGKIPQDLSKFADGVRLIGNDAAHEIDAPTERDVFDIATLTELILTYIYTLPGILDRRRKEAESKAAAE